MFEMKSGNHNFIALKNLIEHKEIVIQKADKGNTVVITDCTKYLEGIKSLLSDTSKLCHFPLMKVNG